MGLFNKFARVTRKMNGLPAVKTLTRAVRKLSATAHYFQRVKIFETYHPERHNIYFYASNGAPLPFDFNWNRCLSK